MHRRKTKMLITIGEGRSKMTFIGATITSNINEIFSTIKIPIRLICFSTKSAPGTNKNTKIRMMERN